MNSLTSSIYVHVKVWRNSGRGREFAKHLQTVNEYTRAIVVKRKAEGGRKDTERMILLGDFYFSSLFKAVWLKYYDYS